MDAEKRTQIAITMTREILTSLFDDPGTMVLMSINEVDPEEIENQVCKILEYLEKTAPEEAEGVE